MLDSVPQNSEANAWGNYPEPLARLMKLLSAPSLIKSRSFCNNVYAVSSNARGLLIRAPSRCSGYWARENEVIEHTWASSNDFFINIF